MMKRCVIVFVLVFSVVLCLCSCGKKEDPYKNYTFGSVGHQAGADGSGYKKVIGEIYELTSETRNIALVVQGATKPYTICVWDIADGGKVACDYLSGAYVYTMEAVSDTSLGNTLVRHLTGN